MKKSEYEDFKAEFTAMQPTPRRGVLDELKKAHVVLLIASGLSRREAAGYVQCAHTTIGRSAAGDPDFAAKLCQAEATAHVQNVTAVRSAAQDPRYWRAAAWMLERRSPEEYAKRDPNSFTADQVMALLTRLYSESLQLLPAEKVQQFQELFDEALNEVEAKTGRADREDEQKRTHLAPRDGLAIQNGHAFGKNGAAGAQSAAASTNGDHPSADAVAEVCGAQSPVPSTQCIVEAASGNGKPHTEHQQPLAEREEYVGPESNGDADAPLAVTRLGTRCRFGQGRRRFDPAQLHQPLHRGGWG